MDKEREIQQCPELKKDVRNSLRDLVTTVVTTLKSAVPEGGEYSINKLVMSFAGLRSEFRLFMSDARELVGDATDKLFEEGVLFENNSEMVTFITEITNNLAVAVGFRKDAHSINFNNNPIGGRDIEVAIKKAFARYPEWKSDDLPYIVHCIFESSQDKVVSVNRLLNTIAHDVKTKPESIMRYFNSTMGGSYIDKKYLERIFDTLIAKLGSGMWKVKR